MRQLTQDKMVSKPVGTSGSRVEVTSLSKEYGSTRVVDDVSFVLEPGQLLTLLGPSGSGKTTTMRMVAGLEEPTEGRIVVGGADITRTAAHRRNIGVVFQQYALFPHLTVFQNVAYPMEMRRLPKSEIKAMVDKALRLVRMEDFAARYPRQLSGGQQQRIALARAVVFRPPVLLMDEPLGALDKRLRELMQLEIRHLQQELGITTISVTHDQVEALVMSDLVAVMDGGRLQQIGTPGELYQNPANRFVADFIGESNILEGDLEVRPADDTLHFRSRRGLQTACRWTRKDTPAPGPVCVVIRPERIRFVQGDASMAPAAETAVRAEIVDRIYVGDLVRFRVRLEGGDELAVKTLSSGLAETLESGSRVTVAWRHEDCLLLAH